MTGYERPSEKGQSATTVSYWAELWRPTGKNAHGESLVSMAFPSEAAAVSWIKAKRRDYEQVGLWKRTSRGSEFDDQPLHAAETPLPDPARLASLVASIKQIAAGKEA